MTAVAPEPRLSDVFLRLADDPALLAEYERDPQAALAAAGLSDAEIDAVLSSPDAARAALETELERDPALRRFITAPRMSTEGDDGDDDDDDDDGDERAELMLPPQG